MGSIKNTIREYGKFEVFYMLVMVIYMGQATPETSRMVGSLSGNPIPLLLPIMLTYMLWKKHPVSFNDRNFHIVLGVYGIWAILSLIKYGDFSTQELSYHFFMVYAIIIAYIHNKVFGFKFLSIYENVMSFICKIAIIGWLIAVIIPPSATFFQLFPETIFGNHVFYLFNWMDPARGQIYSGLLRNAGCSWEPGRFAIMVTLAIFCNLCQNDVKFRNNKNIWWLLVALVTTQSTTGYFTTIIIYVVFLIKKFNLKYALISLLIITPIAYGVMQLDFMGEKIFNKIEDAQDVSRLEQQFKWGESQYTEGEYRGSIDRLDAMAFEWINIAHDPVLGYSRNFDHSYFNTNITSNYVLSNGLLKIIGMYGIPLGLYFFYILFQSSINLAKRSKTKRLLGLFILMCLSSVSYTIFSIPVFTTFWFYGFFCSLKKFNKQIY